MKLLTWNTTLGCWTFNVPVGGRVCKACPHYGVRCYAQTGRHSMPSVLKAQSIRARYLRGSKFDPTILANEITRTEEPVRLFSSGDAQSVRDLSRLLQVAQLTGKRSVWFPTRSWVLGDEAVTTLRQIAKYWTVRLSVWNGDNPPTGFPSSRVLLPSQTISGFHCPKTPGPDNGWTKPTGTKAACIACGHRCWSSDTQTVLYGEH